jgi:histidine ammonia-lyase
MRRAGITPTDLAAKEGLALINGTSVMTAIGVETIYLAYLLAAAADIAGALTLEALQGTTDAFDERIHAVRPHPQQAACAAHLRALLAGSGLVRRFDPRRVQDAYSVRCMPQVHGAARDTISYAAGIVEREINAAVDNPLIFWEGDQPRAISGGNFHGEPVALVMDHLATAVAELGNISERRIARLIDPSLNEGLPAFLIRSGGLNSGFMLPQYVAAALASENKVLAHPASVDTIPTSANTEDHVSMGTIAARQAHEIAENVATILAIELITAAQAVTFRLEECGGCLGVGTQTAYDAVRGLVPFVETDTVLYPYQRAVQEIVTSGELVAQVKEAVAGG